MAQVNAGRVRFIGRGEYNNSTQYYTFDLVNYNGNSYFAKSNTLGNLPTNTTYWQLVAEKGNIGDTGATGNGIASITKTSTSGLVDTYTITFTSGNTTTFNVTNGNGIDRIELTSTSGAVKTYTIYYTNGNTSTFDVTDGEVTQEQLDETNEEVERAKMVYNALPKVNGTGTSITMNNTAECPVYDIELSPSELEQESTSGKNLVNVSEKTGSLNNEYYRDIPTDFILVAGTTYTVSFDATVSETPFILSVGCGVNSYAKDMSNKANQQNGRIYITFTPSSELLEFGNKLFIRCPRYATQQNATYTLKNFQLEIGSSMTDYEEYTGGQSSPNPQYPQEIHTVSGENEVKIRNIQATHLDGYVSVSAGKGIFRNSADDSMVFPVVQGHKYIIHNNGNRNRGAIFENIPTNNTYCIEGTYNASIPTDTEFEASANGYLVVYINTPNSQNVVDDFFAYEVDKLQTYPISLGDLEYCKIGDYEDLFFKNVIGSEYYDSTLELDKWYLKKNVGKVVFTGANEENWTYNDQYNFFAITIPTITNNSVYTNYYLYYPTYSSVSGNYGCWISSTSFRIKNTDYSTTTDFKTWLSTHNTIVYYVLATPTNILLSDTLQTQLDNIQKAITCQDQTNVSQTNNDLPFVIKLSAIRDLSGIFELIQ